MPCLFERTLRAARVLLPAVRPPELTCSLSRQERLGVIFSAVDRCGADCPACAVWALEQDRAWTAWDAEPAGRPPRFAASHLALRKDAAPKPG